MKLIQNKNFWIAADVLIVIAAFFINGCNQHNKGYAEAKTEIASGTIDKKIKVTTDSVSYYRTRYNEVSDSLKKKNEAYSFQLFIHESFQKKANQQRAGYEKTIRLLSDSIKNFKIDSSKKFDNTGTLIAIVNYPITVAQLDTCKKDNEIYKSNIAGKDMQIELCNKESNLKDTLAKDVKAKTDLVEKKLNQKLNGKRFWIFTGWGTAVVETAIGIKLIFFPNKN